MTHPVFPRRAVTALFLERQHLTHPRAHRLSPARLTRFVEDAGGLQMDSINVLDRAHYLTVWSRFGPYDRARLDRLVYRRRLLLEYWAHAACLVPVSMLPWWRRAMLDYRRRHTGWSNWLRRNTKLLALVTETIRANGPMGHAEIRGARSAAREQRVVELAARPARDPLPLDDRRAHRPLAPALPEALRPPGARGRLPAGGAAASPPSSSCAGTWSARSTRWARPPSST